MTLAIVLTFLIFALLRMPLAFALGLASLVGLFVGDMDFSIMPQRMMHSIDNFPLMAIPLFMLAGELMVAAGILQRLVDFANSLVGRVHGGLAHVAILAGMVLAAVSGAAVASASALGSALIPSMREKYGTGYSSAVVASAANLGAIIPPSNAMIVYALMAGSSVSVGGLFMAGVVPGIILAIGFMGLASFISARRRYPLTEGSIGLKQILIQTWRALPILLMPVVIVGGIVAGAFTATEGAAIAVVYALLMGFFVTRQLRLSDLPKAMFRAAITAAMVGALIAFASTMTFAFTIDLIPMQLANWLQDFTSDPMTFMLLVMGLLILVGMFIESNAAFIMLVPLLAPIALSYGIDPLLFGFLFVMNLVVGMMTPPVGVLLFVMCGISQISLNELMKSAWPFIVFQYVVLAACLIFPGIVTWLPRALGY
ncbi:MAG TPA: TRAP transporter large permease [Marinobacter sp.]|uniref:TRAP C4-dicarboxylate transport system permease DctM subunit domain-containing protein n=1 Tax=marine sediment metagenome TaxID=412755 RepID=A0A0F9QC68_9ZZZZ|nr:TRAP transporter large permease [Marinobacter sp.]HEC46262.1 TRAP transporter large permease [Halopseudomonas xinjiangensis]